MINNKVFQIECSLQTLLDRDKTRDGIKEGCRKPLGDEVIRNLYSRLNKTFYKDAIRLNTESMSLQECVDFIKSNI